MKVWHYQSESDRWVRLDVTGVSPISPMGEISKALDLAMGLDATVTQTFTMTREHYVGSFRVAHFQCRHCGGLPYLIMLNVAQ